MTILFYLSMCVCDLFCAGQDEFFIECRSIAHKKEFHIDMLLVHLALSLSDMHKCMCVCVYWLHDAGFGSICNGIIFAQYCNKSNRERRCRSTNHICTRPTFSSCASKHQPKCVLVENFVVRKWRLCVKCTLPRRFRSFELDHKWAKFIMLYPIVFTPHHSESCIW